MTISLSDLKTKRAAMTQGEWVWDPEDDRIRTEIRYEWRPTSDGRQTLSAIGGDSVFDGAPCGDQNSSLMCAPEDAIGIVATHAAADVLIEIAEAALAYRDAPFEDCNACLLRLHNALAKITT